MPKFKGLQFRNRAWEEAIGGTFEADDEPAALAYARRVWGPHSTAVPADYEERARKTWEEEAYEKQVRRIGRRLPKPGDQVVQITIRVKDCVIDRVVHNVERYPDDGEFYAGGCRCSVDLLWPPAKPRTWPAPCSLAGNVRPFIFAFLKDEEAARAHLIQEATNAFTVFANEADEQRATIAMCCGNLRLLQDHELFQRKKAHAATGPSNNPGT